MIDPFSPAGRFEERRRDAEQQRALGRSARTCLNCMNTARLNSCYCGRCEAMFEDKEWQGQLFDDLELAISDLAHNEPVQRAFEAVQAVLKDMHSRLPD